MPADRWQRDRRLEGSTGPLVAEFMLVRAVPARDGLPGPAGWLVVRRTLPTPADTPAPSLVRVSGRRWPLAVCFPDG